MNCPRCQKRAKYWDGDNSKCAFVGGAFTKDNWTCKTMCDLRDLVLDEDSHWSDDQYLKTIAFEGDFIVLGFYKNRGSIELALEISETEDKTLTLETAERFLKGSE